MHRAVFVLLVAVLALVLADGEYYVPRSYYLIDSDGHESNPVPFRRLRRSLTPWPYNQPSANANPNHDAHAKADGLNVDGIANPNGDANAKANSRGRPPIGGNGALGSAIRH